MPRKQATLRNVSHLVALPKNGASRWSTDGVTVPKGTTSVYSEDASIRDICDRLARAVDAGRLDMSDAVATLAGAP